MSDEASKSTSINAVLTDLEAALTGRLTDLGEVGKTRKLASEGEMRRGLIAFNGAGLVAIISLGKIGLNSLAVHAALWLFFVGLLSALAGWYADARYHTVVYRLSLVFLALRAKLSKRDDFDQNLDGETYAQVIKSIGNAIIKGANTARKGSGPIVAFTYVSISAFLLAALLLAMSYQFAPTASQKHQSSHYQLLQPV